MFGNFFKNKKILYLNDRHEEADTGQEGREKIYDKRILPLLDKADAAIFSEKIDPFLWDYYKSFGLANVSQENVFYIDNYLQFPSPTKALLQKKDLLNNLKKKKFDLLLPYIESFDTQKLAKQIGIPLLRSAKFTEEINNKAKLRDILDRLEIKKIPGYKSNWQTVKNDFYELKKQGFEKIVIKKERSVASFGVFVVKDWLTLRECLENNFSDQSSFILEGFVERVVGSPNYQYFIKEKQIIFLGASKQVVDRESLFYQGNQHPFFPKGSVAEKIEKIAEKITNYLQLQKSFGCLGLDFIITSHQEVYLTEINARINGSTFALMLMIKLFGDNYQNVFWINQTYKLSPMPFEKLLDDCHCFLRPGASEGIFPLGVDLLDSSGEVQFILLAQSDRDLKELIKRFTYYMKS